MGRAHPQGAVTRLCVRYLEAARRRFPQSNGHHDGRATASIFPPMAWIFPRALPSSRSQRRRRTTRETTQTSQFRPFPSPLRSNSRHPRGCGDDTPTGSGPRSPGVAETPHPPGCATTGTRRFASGGAVRQDEQGTVPHGHGHRHPRHRGHDLDQGRRRQLRRRLHPTQTIPVSVTEQ